MQSFCFVLFSRFFSSWIYEGRRRSKVLINSFNAKNLEGSPGRQSCKKLCLLSKEDWKMQHSYVYEGKPDIDIFAHTFINISESIHNSQYTNFFKIGIQIAEEESERRIFTICLYLLNFEPCEYITYSKKQSFFFLNKRMDYPIYIFA